MKTSVYPGPARPTILFLFNSSHYAVQPWLDDGGFNCVSVDYSETDHSGDHRPTQDHKRHTRLNIDLSSGSATTQVDCALVRLGLELPSFIVSFAPCTDLAVSGAAHFERKRALNPNFQRDAVALCRLVEDWPCPSIVENPVSVLATMWKKPTGYVHPWQFASRCPSGPHPEFPEVLPENDWYNKKTGLWCQNGACMPVPTMTEGPSGDFVGHTKLGGKSARTKYIRSLTPRGMAKAIYLSNRDNILSEWGTQTLLPVIDSSLTIED
jgi:hypothetical protein